MLLGTTNDAAIVDCRMLAEDVIEAIDGGGAHRSHDAYDRLFMVARTMCGHGLRGHVEAAYAGVSDILDGCVTEVTGLCASNAWGRLFDTLRIVDASTASDHDRGLVRRMAVAMRDRLPAC